MFVSKYDKQVHTQLNLIYSVVGDICRQTKIDAKKDLFFIWKWP